MRLPAVFFKKVTKVTYKSWSKILSLPGVRPSYTRRRQAQKFRVHEGFDWWGCVGSGYAAKGPGMARVRIGAGQSHGVRTDWLKGAWLLACAEVQIPPAPPYAK